MRKLTAVASLVAIGLASACTDRSPGASPTAPSASPSQKSLTVRPGTCFTAATLQTLIKTVLGAGHPKLNPALAKLTIMVVAVAQNKIPQAQAAARDLIAFLNASLSPTTPAAQKAQIQSTINAILCFVGLPPDTYVVLPSTLPQVVVTTDGSTGLNLPGGSVTVPTIFTITTQDPTGPSGLVTKLDQYPTFVTVTTSAPLTQAAVVAICLGTSVPADVFARLRLGHQASTGFEITQPADASFLGCPTGLASAGKVPGWLRSLASLVLPKVAYARMRMFASGGIGGSAIDFSPFGAVDYGLFASGGVGGSAIDFQRKPTATTTQPAITKSSTGVSQSVKPGTVSKSLNPDGSCASPDATVSTPVDTACRPVITVKTAKGTILTGVPVSWAVTGGGGSIAPDTMANQHCGAFGTIAATTTDGTSKAGVCWMLGPNGGANTVTGTPSAGGDAPAGVTFLDPSGNPRSFVTFTANALKITPTATAKDTSTTFDGNPHPGSGTCSNGLTPSFAYTASDGSPISVPVPVNSGTYPFTVTCGGAGVYNSVTTTTPATLTIGKAASATTLNCSPGTWPYTGVAQDVCSASASGAGLSLPVWVPVSYTPSPVVNAGTYVANASWSGDPNHFGSSASPAGSVVISKLPATATAGSGAMSLGGSLPALPCAVSGRLPTEPGAFTCTTSLPATLVPGVNVTTPSVTPSPPPNYSLTLNSGTLTVTYVQSGCFASPISGTKPSATSSSNPKKGTSVTVKCRIVDATGRPVVTATGNLLVKDGGTTGAALGTTVFSGGSFSVTNDGDFDSNDGFYSYVIATSASAFVSGHYYFVTATWNDGSTSTGWFYLK
jgi:hypothetical protein